MRSPVSLLLVLITICTIQVGFGQDIIDIYSSLESFDVAVEGDKTPCTLRVELLSGGRALQTRHIPVDGPGVWVGRWREFEAEEGSYDVCATLVRSGEVLSKMCYDFYYGGRVPLRFDVRDFVADSKGIALTMTSQDPTIVDIEYMLISGDKALYVARENSYSIAGGGLSPVLLSWEWKHLLDEGAEYSGRVKIVEKSHGQTRAFMETFVAREDAKITETYEDETGASATVLGNSRVPFKGSLTFVLYQNETEIARVKEATPVLLVGDDETVEVSWNQTLDPGIYRLKVVLDGRDGEVIDVWESVIEAEQVTRPGPMAQEPEKESPATSAAATLVLMASSLLLKRRLRGRGT